MSRRRTLNPRVPESRPSKRPATNRDPAGRSVRAGPGDARRGAARVAGLIGMLVAVTVTVTGVQATLAARKTPSAASATQADLDGLQARVTGTQVLDHDHLDPNLPNPAGGADPGAVSQPGYQMPPQMMPGMPADGESRLLVRLNLANRSDDARAVDPSGEFVLRNESGGSWPADGDTFGERARLNPRHGVDTGVYFDVPAAGLDQHQWVLEWNRDGRTARLAMALGAQPQDDHSH